MINVRIVFWGCLAISSLSAASELTTASVSDEPKIDCGVEAPISLSSQKRNYFQNLLVNSHASLDDFLVLWNDLPASMQEVDGSPFFDCEKRPLGGLKPNSKGEVDEACKPETLYTWVPDLKLNTMKNLIPANGEWQGAVNRIGNEDRVLFTTMSPSSTAGYGDNLVRLRVKKGTKYRFTRYGANASEVGVADGDFHDFSIRTGDVVESWSYGTPEIYDELVRDVRRFQSKKRVSAYSECPAARNRRGISRLFYQCVDRYPQTEEKLKANFRKLIRQILNHEGKILQRQGLCRSRTAEYQTSHPNYLNPFKAAGAP